MTQITKILIPFAVFLCINSGAQTPCNPSVSPTFQLLTSTVNPAINGFCRTKIEIVNPSGYGGGAVTSCINAPGSTYCIQQPAVVALTPGVWTVIVTDNVSLCATTQTVQVNSLPAPTVSIASTNTLICAAVTATLTASGANSYSWSTGATTSTIPVSPLTNSTYSVIGTATNGCGNASFVTINVMPAPSITVTTDQTSACLNEPVTLTVSGTTSYTWSTQETGSNIIVTPTTTTMYTVQGTDQNGCKSNTSQIQITILHCTDVDNINPRTGEISIFPNPADNYLELNHKNSDLRNSFFQIKIYNNLGQLIRDEEVRTHLQLENLPEGLYFLELNGPEKTLRKRFLIAR